MAHLFSCRPKYVAFAFLRDLEDGLEGLGEVQERVLPPIRGRLELPRLGVRPFVVGDTKRCSTQAQESWRLHGFLIPCVCVPGTGLLAHQLQTASKNCVCRGNLSVPGSLLARHRRLAAWQNKHLLVGFLSSEPSQGVTGIHQESSSLWELSGALLHRMQKYTLVQCEVSEGSVNYYSMQRSVHLAF